MDPWAERVLKGECQFPESDKDWDLEARNRAREAGVKALVTLPLPGKLGPLGIILVGSARQVRFHADELSYLVNIANLLRLTRQNVSLFEQRTPVHRQWDASFDSISDPLLAHARPRRTLRSRQRQRHLPALR